MRKTKVVCCFPKNGKTKKNENNTNRKFVKNGTEVTIKFMYVLHNNNKNCVTQVLE